MRSNYPFVPLRVLFLFAILVVTGFSVGERLFASEESISFLESIEESLERDIVDVWYPRVVDPVNGGFLTNFSADWKRNEAQPKGIVSQSRHVWTCCILSERYPKKAYLKEAALSGAAFLRDHFWDHEKGGFVWMLDEHGVFVPSETGQVLKPVYGNAFAIYALATVFDVTGDKTSLECAKQAFEWLEQYAHDEDFYGYFNVLDQDGVVVPSSKINRYPKGQNTTIHLLEAFTALYRVWPDERLEERIFELKDLLLELIIDHRGFLIQFFDQEWNPVSLAGLSKEEYLKSSYWDHVSFGHDVETAYLLWEAEMVVGGQDMARILEMGKRMLDHTLKNGWDDQTGSIPDGGFYFEGLEDSICVEVRPQRTWWGQAELLNALLMFGKLYPDDPQDYLGKARLTWNYIQKNQIDAQFGGWFEHGIDLSPESKDWPKSHLWKAAYHNSRALLNAREWLEH